MFSKIRLHATGKLPEEYVSHLGDAVFGGRVFDAHCWRDEYTHRLIFRLNEARLPGDAVRTVFDYIDLDE